MKKSIAHRLTRLWPLLILLLLLAAAVYFRLDKFLNYDALQSHHASLMYWTHQYYFTSVIIYMTCYILAVAVSIPGAIFLTLTGGLLFGPVWGSIYVVISATIGATLLFCAVKTTIGHWLGERAKGWVNKLRKGFQENAFSYLMVLRLIPLVPFWVVNIVPALLNINMRVYVTATFLGIIPGSVVYVLVGNGLSELIKMNEQPNLGIIFSWPIMLPLIGLAILSLLPVLYKHFRKK